MFDRMNQMVNLQKAPEIKFKDLDTAVRSTVRYDLLPMQVHIDYIPVTESAVMASVTVVFNRSDLQFKQTDGYAEADVNLYMRLTTMTGRRVDTKEEALKFGGPAEQLATLSQGITVYNHTWSLPPGRYKLTLAAKDVVGENLSTYDVALTVPQLYEDELAASSLILADQLEKVPTKSLGRGFFVIGSTKVRPRVGEVFRQNETLGIYLKIYNLEPDKITHKPEGTVTYEIVQNGTGKKILEFSQDVNELSGGAAQMVVEKKLKLDGFEPGEYTIQIKVNDARRNESVEPSAKFKVI
jgi:hypothetical protein